MQFPADQGTARMTSSTTAYRRPRFVCGIEQPRIDGRTWIARRIKRLMAEYAGLMGGALTAVDQTQIRQAACAQAEQERLQAARLGGEDIAIDDVIRASSEARRCFAPIAARAAKVKPAAGSDLQAYLRHLSGADSETSDASEAEA
jgi:hypothetical protein